MFYWRYISQSVRVHAFATSELRAVNHEMSLTGGANAACFFFWMYCEIFQDALRVFANREFPAALL
jgi:hypothetical protein